MLVLGSSCGYRVSLAERSDCRDQNKSAADSCPNPASEWQVTAKLHLTKCVIILLYITV